MSQPRVMAGLISLIISFSAVITADAQSFNCRNAMNADEVLICQDGELSRLDERMAGLYFAGRNQAYGYMRETLAARC